MKIIWQGENLKVRRKQLGLKMEELARKLGCDRQLIGMWETNKATPSGYNLILVSRVLSIDPNELYQNLEEGQEK